MATPKLLVMWLPEAIQMELQEAHYLGRQGPYFPLTPPPLAADKYAGALAKDVLN